MDTEALVEMADLATVCPMASHFQGLLIQYLQSSSKISAQKIHSKLLHGSPAQDMCSQQGPTQTSYFGQGRVYTRDQRTHADTDSTPGWKSIQDAYAFCSHRGKYGKLQISRQGRLGFVSRRESNIWCLLPIFSILPFSELKKARARQRIMLQMHL